MSQPAFFVGCREDDPTRREIPGSELKPCRDCGAPTYFSPAVLARSEAQHPGTQFLCLPCGAPKLEGITILPPTGAQVEELRQAGHDPESWPLRDKWGKELRRRD